MSSSIHAAAAADAPGLSDAPRSPETAGAVADALAAAATNRGATLHELARVRPLLLVFLRHFGCTFCREAMSDVRRQRSDIESLRVGIALVHTATEEQARPMLESFGLDDLPRVADGEKRLYSAFGLRRGTLPQLFGVKCLIRGVQAGLLDGHGVGSLTGDGFQMPGVFLVHDGRIIRSFRHGSAADRPDYLAVARG